MESLTVFYDRVLKSSSELFRGGFSEIESFFSPPDDERPPTATVILAPTPPTPRTYSTPRTLPVAIPISIPIQTEACVMFEPIPVSEPIQPWTPSHSAAFYRDDEQRLEAAIKASKESYQRVEAMIKRDEGQLEEFLGEHGLCTSQASRQERDGDCWCGSLAFACCAVKGLSAITPRDVRRIALETLRQYATHYLPFFSTTSSLSPSHAEFMSQCDLMASHGAWKSPDSNIGDLLVDAFARRMRVRIKSYNSDRSITLVGGYNSEDTPVLLVAYVATPGHEHYHGIEKNRSVADIRNQKYREEIRKLCELGHTDVDLNGLVLDRVMGHVGGAKAALEKLKKLAELGYDKSEDVLELLQANKWQLDVTVKDLANVK